MKTDIDRVVVWIVVIALCTFLMFLSGCATPDPIVVRVPVPVKCIESVPERPALLSDAELAALTDDYIFVIQLARDRRLRQGYQALLEAAVEGCR